MNRYNVEVRKTMVANIEVEVVDETIAKMFAAREAEKLGPEDWIRVGKLRIGDPVKIMRVSEGEYAYIAELPDDYRKIDADGVTIKRVKIIKTGDETVTVEFPDRGTTEVIYELVASTINRLVEQVDSYVQGLERADFLKRAFERRNKLMAIRDELEARGDV